eukprot:4248388-Amphidinium_carterae.1
MLVNACPCDVFCCLGPTLTKKPLGAREMCSTAFMPREFTVLCDRAEAWKGLPVASPLWCSMVVVA